jgi:transcriptional regulator
MWRDVITGVEALAMFQGPDSYVSPSWYPTEREHGKAVPTWNYAVVHAYGGLRIIDDPAWLRDQLEALTAEIEKRN